MRRRGRDITERNILTKEQLDLLPLYGEFEFDDWVQDIINGQPHDDDNEDVVVYKNSTGKVGKGAVRIGDVTYANCLQASKCLGVSNSMIYKWLRSGVAKRVEEELVAEPSSIEASSIEINKRLFKSIDAAAKRLGVDKSVIIKWLELNI